MSREFKPIATVSDGESRVEFYDFGQRPNKSLKNVRIISEPIDFLEYHDDSCEFDILCTRCFWRGYMTLTFSYPMAELCCPMCQMDGGMVRG